MNNAFICSFFFCLIAGQLFAGYSKEQNHYWNAVMPIMRTHCNKACHNADDQKGGLNLNKYDFIKTIQKEGHVFVKVLDHLSDGTMPPPESPRLTQKEMDTLTHYINKYLNDALDVPDPGLIMPRRLNNNEYKYVIDDLFDYQINTDSIFPKDAGGGEGFDNYAKTLYLTPLLMERYYDVADNVIEGIAADDSKWRSIVPAFKVGVGTRLKHWWVNLWEERNIIKEYTNKKAKDVIIPIATLGYRRHLGSDEKDELLNFFDKVFQSGESNQASFDTGVKEVFKAIMISPHFLIRHEGDPPLERPYLVSNFELASRLSFFIWNSIPDVELLEAAYRDDLHNPEILQAQVERMVQSPKSKRMVESFASQWLGIDKLNDITSGADREKFPAYTNNLRDAMYGEAVEYFYHVFKEEKDLLKLLKSDYSFLNEELAQHYGIDGVKGEKLRKVQLPNDGIRGGILGMAGVLTSTSLPNRTSPVLRGKWVMEKILATPAKPPPPNVPELEATKDIHDELNLRELLVMHRADPACSGCHQDMDDLGFALENFDAIGRWRTTYEGDVNPLDANGVLMSGEQFEGVKQLIDVLLDKKEKFAQGLSKKMLGYALGRSIVFKDKKTVEQLSEVLMENDFNPLPFVQELVNSYPFRYKRSDPVIVDTAFGD